MSDARGALVERAAGEEEEQPGLRETMRVLVGMVRELGARVEDDYGTSDVVPLRAGRCS